MTLDAPHHPLRTGWRGASFPSLLSVPVPAAPSEEADPP